MTKVRNLLLLLTAALVSSSMFAAAPVQGTVGNGIYEFTASDHHNFIWYRIAKNGTRTMVSILKDSMGQTVDQDVEGMQRTPYDHEHYKDHFKFTFVRNPWARVVSCYFNKVYGKHFAPFRECKWASFEEWVDWLAKQDLDHANIHIQRQSRFIPPGVELDFIGRLENYEEDIKTVMARFGVYNPAIPKLNATTHHHYSRYYNDRTRELVRKLYEEDIVRFGYEFERQ